MPVPNLKLRNRLIQEENQKPHQKKKKEDEGPQITPLILAILLFVVVGSSIFQIIRNAQQARALGERAQIE